MLKNLPLTLKLFLAPSVAIFGLVLYVGYTSFQLSANDLRLQALETRNYPALEKADAVIFQFSRVPGLLNGAVAAGEANLLAEADSVLRTIETSQAELGKLIDSPQRQQQLDDWRAAVERYAGNATSVSSQLVTGGASFEDVRPNLDRMARDLDTAQRLGDDFRSAAYAEFAQTLVHTREANATTTRVGITLSAVLLVLVSLCAWTVTRSIMANVRGVIDSLQRIAGGEGDLTRRVSVESNDEIGVMIQLFNNFLGTLQATIRQIINAASPIGECSKELYRLTQGS